MCLEEMTNVKIPQGAIFYGKTINRLNVEFDKNLREETTRLAKDFHNLINFAKTPKPEYSKKCDNCSFKEICLPEVFSKKKTIKEYLWNIINQQT
jgi:CRISPR-associated exonuclease Cas4